MCSVLSNISLSVHELQNIFVTLKCELAIKQRTAVFIAVAIILTLQAHYHSCRHDVLYEFQVRVSRGWWLDLVCAREEVRIYHCAMEDGALPLCKAPRKGGFYPGGDCVGYILKAICEG